MSSKSVVLLSAGLDSTVNLFESHQQDQVQLVLSFNYGQKAAKKEVQQAALISKLLHLKHQVVDIPFVKQFGKSALIDDQIKIPTSSEVQIDHRATSQKTAKSVWVPNRNGILLNIAAGFAEAVGADFIIPGFNAEEAATFPDNSLEFMKKLDQSFYYSTSNHVQVKCYTVNMNKTEIVKRGKELQVPFKELWPCYFDGEKICGQCESCLRYQRAMNENGMKI